MSTIWVQLGKVGDILSILPCVHREFERSGKRQNLLVAKEYASVVDGIDYVEPKIWNGHWQDLRGALLLAKREFKRVHCPSTFGKDFPIQHRAPSFQLDQRLRIGCDLDPTALVLPRPQNADELVKAHCGAGRSIVVCDHSESSPFDHRDDLWKTINYHFGPTHKIIRLSEIKLPNIKDFLPIIDAADAMISIDTAFLHLSAACKTPVVALATTKPERWHGSAWSKRFAFYCRYDEWPTSKDGIVRCLDNIVNKRPNVEIYTIRTRFRHGYNFSITRFKDELVGAYRYHPQRGHWRTEIAIDDRNVKVPKEIANHSVEDPRLFQYQGKLWMSYTASPYPSTVFRCVVGYGELEKRDDGWELTRHIQPKFSTNDFTSLQKNWLFFEHDKKLFAIYGVHPEQTIIQLDGDQVVGQFKSAAPKWGFGEIRGGAIVPYRNRLLRFFHSRSGSGIKNYEFRYHVGALVMEPAPPFKAIAISRSPIISGHEGWSNCQHWKPNVVFPGGAVQDGDRWKLSLGINDSSCETAMVGPEHLNLVNFDP